MSKRASVLIVVATIFSVALFPFVKVSAAVSSQYIDHFYATRTVDQVRIYVDGYVMAAKTDTTATGGVTQSVLIYAYINNSNSLPALVNNANFNMTFNNTTAVMKGINPITSDLTLAWDYTHFDFVPSAGYQYGNGIVVPPNSTLYLVAEIEYNVYLDSSYQNIVNLTFQDKAVSSFTVGLSADYPYYSKPTSMTDVTAALAVTNQLLQNGYNLDTATAAVVSDIYTQLGLIYQANAVQNQLLQNIYNVDYTYLPAILTVLENIRDTSSLGASGLDQLSQTTSTQIDTLHQQEQSMFNNNQQALNGSGITNFQFDDGISSGLTGFRGLFERLWEALHPYNRVYTFSMLLSLALLIIRYAPPRKQSGGKNGSNS